jgi:hypothetical protein
MRPAERHVRGWAYGSMPLTRERKLEPPRRPGEPRPRPSSIACCPFRCEAPRRGFWPLWALTGGGLRPGAVVSMRGLVGSEAGRGRWCQGEKLRGGWCTLVRSPNSSVSRASAATARMSSRCTRLRFATSSARSCATAARASSRCGSRTAQRCPFASPGRPPTHCRRTSTRRHSRSNRQGRGQTRAQEPAGLLKPQRFRVAGHRESSRVLWCSW